MKGLAALAVIAIVAGAAPCLAGGATPQAVTEGFYATYLSLKPSGIPDAKARARLQPFISPALDHLLIRSEAAEAQYRKATSEQAPPLVEGDIFSSLFEGATAFRLESCQTSDTGGQCRVALTYTAKGEAPTQWTDNAMLVRTAEGWRVGDIGYGGTWPFGNKGTLTENLKFAIENAGGTAQ